MLQVGISPALNVTLSQATKGMLQVGLIPSCSKLHVFKARMEWNVTTRHLSNGLTLLMQVMLPQLRLPFSASPLLQKPFATFLPGVHPRPAQPEEKCTN